MPFTLRNLKEDLEDVGPNFDGAPDLHVMMNMYSEPLEFDVPAYAAWQTAINTFLDSPRDIDRFVDGSIEPAGYDPASIVDHPNT